MNARNALMAAVAGFAGFMLATVAVTALLEPRIEFSVLVGLPVGILAGLVVTAFVYRRLTGPADERGALAIVAAAIGFVATMALMVTFGMGVTLSILVAIAACIGVGAATYVLDPTLED